MRPAVRPVVLGVAGGSGAGKSTVVREVRRMLGPGRTSVIHHDAYYRDLSHLPPAERNTRNFDHPESLETELLVEHLGHLVAGHPVDMPIYDFRTHSRRQESRRLVPRPVLLIDGILVLADPRLRDLMDLKAFVDTDEETRLHRRIRRDMRDRGRTRESVLTQFQTDVRPMHHQFVEPSRAFADVIIREGGYNREAVFLMVDRLRRLLAERLPPPPLV
ncbi:MAG: uridine kinase [Gemmatimonadota bacterium]